MRTYDKTFTGAEATPFAIPGRYFRLMLVPTGNTVDVNLYRNGSIVYEAKGVEAGFYAIPKDGFDRFEIVSTVAQTIKFAISDGYGGYDRTVGSVAISGGVSIVRGATLGHAANANVGLSAGQVLSALAGTKAAYFRADAANTAPIYLGGSGVTTANAVIRLNPGDVYIDDTIAEAQWWAISTAAAQTLNVMRGT